jgi:hypothetical protein
MATKYHNISGELTQELLAAGDNITVSSLSFCNLHASTTCTIDLYIEKKLTGKFYIMKGISLAVGTTLNYDLNINNSTNGFGLYIKLTKGASETPLVDVIIS